MCLLLLLRWRLQHSYMARDAAEIQAAQAQPSEDLRAQYVGMHMTERLAVLPPRAEPSWTLQSVSAQEQVAAYRRARGLPTNVRTRRSEAIAHGLPQVQEVSLHWRIA